MSFQDVGKPGSRSKKPSHFSTQPTIPENSSSSSAIFSQVSDGILQYQRNVGILEKIAAQIGTKADGPVLDTQYNVQVDVLQQLGQKLETQLETQEKQLESLSRSEASKRRATHVKLTRDFRRVEMQCKNVQLETKRKRARQQTTQVEQPTSAPAGTSEEEQAQLQLQQTQLNEDIMREREEEIRNINRGMHTVNEIYKDLAHIVGSQQEQIDQIETDMDESRANAEAGLQHVSKANEKAGSQCTIS